jgi:beta-lactamase regulating signal transducer with metallopeptidase domain
MNQFFTFMVDWSLRSAVTVALGFACVLLLHRRSAATRNLIWLTTLSAVVLLPIAMAIMPKQGTSAVMEPIQAPVRAVILPIDPPRTHHAIKNRKYAETVARADLEGTFGAQVACLLYVAGFAATLGLWIAGFVKVRRIARMSAPATGVSSPYRVLLSKDAELRVPITFGLAKPVIVLPAESEGWPEQRLRAAILHESAHIARKDWAWQTTSNVVRALQWFNPAIWLLNGALNSTAEAAADDEVLMQFAMGAADYAGELLNVAEAASGVLRAATAMARPGGVAGRLRRIVAKGIDRGRPRPRFVFGLGVLFGLGAVLVAAGTVAEAAGDSGVVRKLGASHLLSMVAAAMPDTKDGSYEVKLSHGGTVRMVAMEQPGIAKGQLWRPDGSPATQADKTLLEPILDRSTSDASSDGRVINFYLQVSRLPMKPGETENGIFRVKQARGWQYRCGSNTSESDGRLQWDQWTAPRNAQTCDMDCAVSYGSYKVIGHGTIGDGRFHAEVGDSHGDWTNVSLQLHGKFGDEQAKLECYDSDGNLIPGGGEVLWGNEVNGSERFEFAYRSEDAKRIASFQFSTRSYEHVVIKGIRLPPTGIQP